MPDKFLVLALAAALAVPAAAQRQQQNVPPAPPPQPEQTQTTEQPAAETQQQDSDLVFEAEEREVEPLEVERREGFFGRINPFARKSYVQRQLDPVRNRVNELDELTARNARAIREVDARATEGIRLADEKASAADRKATEAGETAQRAHQTAETASTRLTAVEQALDNLDNFEVVTQAEIRFASGQGQLSQRARAALDEIVEPLKNERGWVVTIHGYAPGQGRAGMERSQNLAQAVARYLVLEHQIPVHRIYTVGMGNAVVRDDDGQTRRATGGGRVEINLMRNSIGELATSAGMAQHR